MKDGLERFVSAQEKSYDTALQEIRTGRKRSHWMWYIFPQIAGLGHSQTARYYAIKDMEEARAYMKHEILGKNLIEISQALLQTPSSDPGEVMGWPDDMKLKSSMTLFLLAAPEAMCSIEVFHKNMLFFFVGILMFICHNNTPF